MGYLVAIVIFLGLEALSFVVSAGIVKLICLCFGLAFSWKFALGIWLILSLLSPFFKSSGGSE